MAFAIDANVLIAAANGRDPRQQAAADALQSAATGDERFYLYWPVIAAYLRVLTTVETARHPLSLEEAWTNIESLLALEHCATAGESLDFAATYKSELIAADARGKFVHDAHIVALMRTTGVTAVWTFDRDFRRFDGVRVMEPGS